MKKTILVTGAGGFIGGNIVRHFGEIYEIFAPRHAELDLVSQESVDRFFREHQVDYVIHCASVGGSRKSGVVPESVQKNLRMFFNLTRNRNHFGKMIHFGSGAEYDKTLMRPCVLEEDFGKQIPLDDYGFAKYVISRSIENLEGVYCLRLFGVFGPGEDYEYRFISNAILKNMQHMPIRIMQNVYFDWLYIHDLMRIVDHFLHHDMPENTYNVTSGTTVDLLTIAGMINERSPYKSPVVVVNEGLNREYSGSNGRLIRDVGRFDFTPMSTAIAMLYKYYESEANRIKWDAIMQDPYAVKCSVQKTTGPAK